MPVAMFGCRTPGVRPGALGIQMLVAGLTILILFAAPPARGPMLIVSLSGQDAGAIARWAVRHEARLLGAGPWPHSLMVVGARSALFGEALAQGGLLIRGTAAGCGEAGNDDRG
jgi:hypothetical protein